VLKQPKVGTNTVCKVPVALARTCLLQKAVEWKLC